MVRRDGVDHSRNIVIEIGAPRSGTSWLQRLLGADPRIVTSQETELLSHYAWPWIERFRSESDYDPQTWLLRRHRGLPAILDEESFVEVVRSAVLQVYGCLRSGKPGAEVVLDKSPEYSLIPEAIELIVPNAKVLHLVRDGRAVTRSLRRASAGWGRDWAPPSTREAATRWAGYVERARGSAAHPGGYLEVRYEDLVDRAEETLGIVFDFLGLSYDPQTLKSLTLAAEVAGHPGAKDVITWGGEVVRRLGGAPPEPPGFFPTPTSGEHRGSPPGWTAYDEWLFWRTAGALNRSLGWAPEERPMIFRRLAFGLRGSLEQAVAVPARRPFAAARCPRTSARLGSSSRRATTSPARLAERRSNG